MRSAVQQAVTCSRIGSSPAGHRCPGEFAAQDGEEADGAAGRGGNVDDLGVEVAAFTEQSLRRGQQLGTGSGSCVRSACSSAREVGEQPGRGFVELVSHGVEVDVEEGCGRVCASAGDYNRFDVAGGGVQGCGDRVSAPVRR
ncbi:hypothetical protein ACFVYA_13495 [Amycolatopsis sp. NPDC058278]|uniref:hypothetical protein n=1 Tax=Amycolatopsis sp. NPDC058278 TaxID=3346417 RepID=UPI0036DACB76